MGIVIAPSSPMSNPTPFAELLNKPEDMGRISRAFMASLEISFRVDQQRNGRAFRERIQTEPEIKRRSNILGKWFRTFRGDLGLSLVQTIDELPKALRAELDGTEYTPPEKSRLWSPEGARE